MPTKIDTPYKSVRSLERGLAILEALAEMGWAKPALIAKKTGIDRATVYRLADNLVQYGFVTRRVEDGCFALSDRIVHLASAVRHDDLLIQVAAPHLRELTARVRWPSDMAILDSGTLSIALSTHNMSAMSMHRAMVGKQRPLLRSALGKALMSVMGPSELDQLLDLVTTQGGDDARQADFRIGLQKSLEQVRTDGYAAAEGTIEAGISAIALPIRGPWRVVGAVNIIFFRSALSPQDAARDFLPELRAHVDAIETDFRKALSVF